MFRNILLFLYLRTKSFTNYFINIIMTLYIKYKNINFSNTEKN